MLSFLYTSNQDAAQQSQLLNLNRAGLAASGRVAGYTAEYMDGCGGLCWPGFLNVSTEVHVFRTAAEASRFFAKQEAVYPSLEGKEVRYGPVTSVEVFDPGLVGDERVGVRSRYLSVNEPITETLIMFRVEDVFGFSSAANLRRPRYPDARADRAGKDR